MATKDATDRTQGVYKVSVRIDLETRQDLKAVASLAGTNVERLVLSLINDKLASMSEQLQALRMVSAR